MDFYNVYMLNTDNADNTDQYLLRFLFIRVNLRYPRHLRAITYMEC